VTPTPSFLEAYRIVQRDVERFALFLCRDRMAAADVTQDAVLAAFENWSRIETVERLKSYVITTIIRCYHRQRRNGKRHDELVDVDSLLSTSSLSAEDLADLEIIRNAIAVLPYDLRVSFVLAEVEGWPHKNIASMLNLSLSAVKMRVKRARDLLRARLQDPSPISHELNHDR